MNHYVTTALGREVPAEDWAALHRDTILKVLHDYGTSPFNAGNLPLSVTPLVNATGLSAADVASLCEQLRVDGFVDVVEPGQFRVTARGIVEARNARPWMARRGVG